MATPSTTGITGLLARRASYAFKYRLHASHAYTRYRPSGVANEVMSARSAVVTVGARQGFELPAERAPAADQMAFGGGRYHGEVWLTTA